MYLCTSVLSLTHTRTHTLKGSITPAVSGAATVTVYLNSKCMYCMYMYVSACTYVLQFSLTRTRAHTHAHTNTLTHTHTLKGSITPAVSGAATVTVYLNSKCMNCMYVSACTYVLQFFLSHAHTHTMRLTEIEYWPLSGAVSAFE